MLSILKNCTENLRLAGTVTIISGYVNISIKTGLLPLLFKDFVPIAVYLLVSMLSFRYCVYINLLPASQSELGYGTMRLLI